MAAYWWVSAGANNWNTSGTWSLIGSGGAPQALIPGAGDTANFDLNGAGNCTLTANVNIATLVLSGNYIGTFSGGIYNVTTTAVMALRSDVINCGSGDWTCGGNFFAEKVGTYTIGTADFYLTGSNNSIVVDETYFKFKNLYVSGVYACSGGGTGTNLQVSNILDITGTLSLGSVSDGSLTLTVDSDLRIQPGGTITNRDAELGAIQWFSPQVGITDLRGTFSNQLMTVYYPHTNAVWDPGTYDVRVDFVTSPSVATVVNFQAGPYTWTGGLLQFRVGITGEPHDFGMTINLNNSTQMTFDDTTQLGFVSIVAGSDGDITLNSNGADWIFASDLFQNITASTTLTWVKGSGLITCNGGVDQSINFGDQSVEDIVINKTANTVSWINALQCETYTLTAGTSNISDDASTWGVNLTGGTQIMTGTNKTWTCTWMVVSGTVSTTLDVNDNNVTISGTGGLSFIQNCTITMGQRTWTCNGDVLFTNDTTVLVSETSLLKLTGVGTFTSNASTTQHYLYQVEIPVGATRTVLAGSVMRLAALVNSPKLMVDGTLTLTGDATLLQRTNLYVSATGIINGVGFMQFFVPFAGYGIVTMDGTISIDAIYFDMPAAGSLFQPATYDCNVVIRQYGPGDHVWEPENGTYTITGDLNFQSSDVSGSTLTVNCSANNPLFNLQQNVDTVAVGGFTWIAGTGYIVFDGIGNHTIDFNDEIIDDTYVQKDSSGKITLAENFSAASLTLNTGKFDANDYDVDITGDFVMENGSGIECWCGAGSTWTIGGDFNFRNVITDVFHAETSEIILVGSGNLNTYCSGWINNLHKLTVSGTYTLVAASVACTIYSGSGGWLKLVNGGHLTTEDALYVRDENDLIIEVGGRLTNNGDTYLVQPNAGYGTTNAGIIDGTGTLYFQGFVTDSVAGAGNYSVDDILIQPQGLGLDFTFGPGSWITKNIEFQAAGGNINIDMDTNDPIIDTNGNVTCNGGDNLVILDRTGTTNDWSIEGNFTTIKNTGDISYVKGSANLIFDGSANSTYTDVANISVENVLVNKSANALFLGSLLTCDSLKNLDGDFNAQTFAVNVGDVTWTTDVLQMGSGTWTCSGNFDVDNIDVTWGASGTTLVMTGINKNLIPKFLGNLLNLVIDTGASITWDVNTGDYATLLGTANIDGTFNMAAATQIVFLGILNINATGIFGDGNGNIWLRGDIPGEGIQTYDGSLNVDYLYIHPSTAVATDLLSVAGTYTTTSGIQFVNSFVTGRIISLGTGNYTFDTPVTMIRTQNTGSLIIDNTAGANIIFTGGVQQSTTSTGTRQWLKGVGSITLSGTAAGVLKAHLMAVTGEWEEIEVTGGIHEIYENLTTEGFTLTAGTWNSSTFDITTSGDFEVVDGIFNAGSGTWTVSGNADFTSDGTFNRETSNFIFDGSGVTITGGGNDATLYKIHFHPLFDGILAGTLESSTNVGSLDVLIDGTVDVIGGLTVWNNTDVVLGSTANFSGIGTLRLDEWDGELSVDPSAILSPALMYFDCCEPGMILPARDYAADGIDLHICYCDNILATFELQTGNTSFDNVIVINEGTYTSPVWMSSGTNFHITGNLDVEEQSTGSILWSTTGDTYLSGTGDITANTNNISVGKLHILKNSGVTLTSNLSVQSLDITTGNFDANDYWVTVGAGDTTWATANTISMGSGNWYLLGNLDYTSITGPLKQETSLLIMAGTGKTIESNNHPSYLLHDVNIDGTISSSGSLGDWIYSDGDLNINDTLTLSNQGWRLETFGAANWTNGLYVNSGGELTGSGTLRMLRPNAGGGLLGTNGDLTIANLEFARPEEDGLFPAYDYSTISTVRILQYTPGTGKLLWQSGPYTFNNLEITSANNTDLPLEGRTLTPPASITVQGNATFTANSTGDIIIYNNHASQDLDWIFQGNVTTTENSTGEIVWHKGSGSLSFTGTAANQVLDLDVNGVLEELTINKTSGQVTFTSNWIAESLMASNGAIDFNGQTVQTSNDFVINTDATIVADADAMDGTDITVGANFFVSSVTFNATSNWFLDVQGTSATAVTTAVAYSIADAGLEINATADSNTDLLNNSNWNFIAVADVGGQRIQSLSIHCFPWSRMTGRSSRGFRSH